MTADTGAPGHRSRLGGEVRRAGVVLVPAAVAVWLVMCAVGYLLTHPLEHRGFTKWEGSADRFFAAHRTAAWNSVTKIASLVGDTPAIIAVAAVSFVALRVVTRRWRASVFVLAAMVGEVSIFSSATIVVDRARPTVTHLDGSPPTSSFPSGHTAAATTMYGLLAIIAVTYAGRTAVRVLAVAVAVVIVVSIGVSRLYRGMHYPTDVLGGVLLGLLWLTATTMVVMCGRCRPGACHRGKPES